MARININNIDIFYFRYYVYRYSGHKCAIHPKYIDTKYRYISDVSPSLRQKPITKL